jgi:prepilin-type N-terminal cleavage/methylation domain-containing protein
MNLNFHKNISGKNNQKGFTLIETLVSLAIFASSITGLIAITAGGISNSTFVKNKFTASYLALEGEELVHNLRDTKTNSGGTWEEVTGPGGILYNCIGTTNDPKACYVGAWEDSYAPNPVECSSPEDCPNMTYQKSTGRFSYHSIDNSDYFNSIFKRIISIKTVSLNEVEVTSKVEWRQGSELHNVSYTSELLNWTAP